MKYLHELHRNWKGEEAVNCSISHWVIRYKGRANSCSKCKREDAGVRYVWMHKGKNKRNLTEYFSFCYSCFMKDVKNKAKSIT